MIVNLEALYEFINITFWSALVFIAALFLVKPFLNLVERWSNGGKHGH